MIGLCISAVNFSYKDQIVLKNASVCINSPGITCLTGNNGSGKSTLLRLLHGLIKPQSGCIEWLSPTQAKIAMVFQKPLMLRRSVLANIKFVLKIANNATDPLHYLHLLDLVPLANKSARSLSGGEQQKLALARMLALQPDIMLLDEPTSYLDPDASLKIEQLLLNLSAQNKKIVLVSHDMHQVKRMAQDRLHLASGELVYVQNNID